MNNQKLQIAKEILSQLGGNQFIAITGAKNIAGSEDGTLSFKIGKNCKKITHVSIKLNGLDLYDMTFYNIHGLNVKKETVNNAYNEDLQKIFTMKTGLNTYL